MNTKRRATNKKRREPKRRKQTISVSLAPDVIDGLRELAHLNYRNLSCMVEVLISKEHLKQVKAGAFAPITTAVKLPE